MTAHIASSDTGRGRVIAWGLLVVGVAGAAYGLRYDSYAWPSLLLNSVYIVSLGVSAAFFLASQRVTGARWSAGLRRVPEAFTMILPAASLLMIALFLGRNTIFSWSHAGAFDKAPALAGKVQYLQMPWVITRTLIALALWTAIALLMRRTSLAQDRSPDLSLKLHERLTRLGILFVPVFAVTFSLFAFDWLISLQPEWFSTMFAVYVFAGTFVQGIAAVTLATVLLKQRGPLSAFVSDRHLHDLGKMLFAFSTFWAYIWVGQYLLIWYGNIPDEISHFVSRTNGPWLYLFALNFLANWVVPFIVLLPASAKQKPKVLIAMSVLLLAGHGLDLYLLIMPSFRPAPGLGLSDLAMTCGFGALVYLLFTRALARAPLVPLNDPILNYEEAREHVPALELSGAKQ
jgi:hypothetical protein